MAPAFGFRNAPFSKCLFIAVLLFGVVLRTMVPKANLSFDLPRVLSRGEIWRLLTCHIGFQSFPQTLLGLILLYQFRQLERQMGPRKFSSFLAFSLFLNTSIQAALCLTIDGLVPSPGPFAIIYALFPFFYECIPHLHPSFSIRGVVLSEKTWTYLIGSQLMLSDGFRSMVSCLGGLLAGMLYMNDGLGLQSWRFPTAIEPYFAALGRVIDPPEAPRSPLQEAQRRRLQQQNLQHAQLQAALASLGMGGAGAMPNLAPPSEESILTLMGMGFDRERVVQALRTSNNNVEVAANWLLSGR